ncbi:MAG: xanthine dehydrogenase family protein subunit M [candidate division KSB1 bacterium]|nr:xanthine dehydrogenase family protein subunit M [candidate division KSB1 bacterium]
MKSFSYIYPKNLKAIPRLLADYGDKALLYAGGTDALARLKDGIVQPEAVINLKQVTELTEMKEDRAGLRIGAAVRLADILDFAPAKAYPGLIEAVQSVGTIQLRNMGTIGGNLCQRPRCWYYRSSRFPCFRKGGELCYAIYGENKYHCILGGDPCYIVHPSDVAPMLIALDAEIEILGAKKSRRIKAETFYVLPEQDPYHETVLAADEVVTQIIVPARAKRLKSHYLKFRERDSFDFAMVSVAAAGRVEGDRLFEPRIVLGGVAPKPWRALKTEAMLSGQAISEELLLEAAKAELAQAAPLDKNEYKVPLVRNLIKRAVMEMMGKA